ncbi:tyrosyl-DNA phosphodiesterase-domain-containing protein [Coniochaeta sp. 2T2.1]|nr:tyrosyl-DNA phosphodiesterase-domain-containing protein [Coniochaeta sp. 2T2.1]
MADRWAEEFNGDSDDDEALRMAIAMSLGEEPPAKPKKKKPITVDLTQDDGDGERVDLTREEDIETASEASSPGLMGVDAVQPAEEKPAGASGENGDRKSEPKKEEEQSSTAATSEPAAPASSLSALLGLDRAKMEEERLARVRKRKAAEEGQSQQADSSKRVKTNDENRRPDVTVTVAGAAAGKQPAARQQAMTSIPARPQQKIATLSSLAEQRQAPEATRSEQGSSNLPFPKGVVKKTWCRGQPRLGDDITIAEVLRKDECELALISSFQWDQEWMYEQFDLRKTKLILVSQGGSDEENEALRASVPDNRMRFVFPPLNGPGNMHSKLQILKFRTYLRIVVPTGNFVPYDWGETGVMENMVFIIDLPLIQDEEKQKGNKLTPFGEELVYFLEKQTVPDRLVRSLRKYDFEETRRFGFVHSVAGGHADDAWRRTGYCGLGRTVKDLGLSTDGLVEVDILTSSLGAMTYDFLQMIYGACQGDSGLQEYEARTAPKSKKTADAAAAAERLQKLRSHLRVYFPSETTIDQSRGGRDNAGTIFFMSRWWDQTTFPKAVLRDCLSKRAGLLMHNKVIYVRRKPSSGPSSASSTTTAGFAYVGSANMSESAWGRLVKDKASGGPKITCRNWECGVVLPVDDRQARRDDGLLGMFEGTVPVPMQLPGAAYVDTSNNSGGNNSAALSRLVMKPWCQR